MGLLISVRSHIFPQKFQLNVPVITAGNQSFLCAFKCLFFLEDSIRRHLFYCLSFCIYFLEPRFISGVLLRRAFRFSSGIDTKDSCCAKVNCLNETKRRKRFGFVNYLDGLLSLSPATVCIRPLLLK